MRFKTMLVTVLCLSLAGSTSARRETGAVNSKGPSGPMPVLVLDGSPVHDVGQLQLHTSNWGMFGSWPGSGMPFSNAPSAEWPEGSGVEYLFGGGLWVGAIDNGVPKVSTAFYTFEFRPTDDPLDVVYYSAEGAAGGSRLPSANADDDSDGMIDEDPLDGHDNDNDGKVDEDYAAISTQMLSRWYTDDQPIAQQVYPDHYPMGLLVRERSYQWDHVDFDDFVGVDYEVTNMGDHVLEDMYVGVYFDPDVGRRSVVNYWEDDGTDFAVVSMPGGGTYDFAYGYDVDADGGTANGNFGVVVLDHPTDPTGVSAPVAVGASTYAAFSGSQSFEDGGDPTNDFERYELMARETVERSPTIPADFRVLVAVGPFTEILPGETIRFTMALVATPRDGSFENVVNAATVYEGEWFDVDGDPSTGGDGKEYQAHWWLPGQTPTNDPVAAEMRCTPRTVNVTSKGAPLLAHVTLPHGYSVNDVDESTLRMNGSMQGTIHSGNDGKFVARFSRKGLMQAPAGDMEAQLTFVAAGQPFVAVDHIRVIGGGGPMPAHDAATGVLRASHSPNPFNPTARIAFELPRDADVTLDIYAADGTLVRRLLSGGYPAGAHDAIWQGRDDGGREVASGIYFYRLVAGGETLTKKMVLIK